MYLFHFLAHRYYDWGEGGTVPLFWISGDVFSGFQSQSVFLPYSHCEGECHVRSLRYTYAAISANLLTVSIVGQQFKTTVQYRHLNQRCYIICPFFEIDISDLPTIIYHTYGG